jgi:hypothetical protein
MEGIENLDFGRFRTQGTVGVGVYILISTASFLPAASIQPPPTGFTPGIPSSCRSRSSAACSEASSSIFCNESHATNSPAWTPPSSAACYARTGSFMPSPLLGSPNACFATLTVTLIAWPSATSAYFASMVKT